MSLEPNFDDIPTVKILVIGDRIEGKGLIKLKEYKFARNFKIDNRFDKRRDSTHSTSHNSFYFQDPNTQVLYKIEFLDNINEESKSLADLLNDTNTNDDISVVALCFSLVERNSKESLKEYWYKEVKKCLPKRPIVIVGLHAQLRNEFNVSHITQTEGEQLKKDLKAKGYFEYSTNDHKHILQDILKIYERKPRKRFMELAMPFTKKPSTL